MFAIYIVCWRCGLEEELGVTLDLKRIKSRNVESLAIDKGFTRTEDKWYCSFCRKGNDEHNLADRFKTIAKRGAEASRSSPPC